VSDPKVGTEMGDKVTSLHRQLACQQSSTLLLALNTSEFTYLLRPGGWRCVYKPRPGRFASLRQSIAVPGAQTKTPSAAKVRTLLQSLGLPLNYGVARDLPMVPEPECLQAEPAKKPLWLEPETLQAWQAMRQHARESDIALHAISGFRSVHYQAGIIRRKLQRGQSVAQILRVSAAPGYSEHHSGRAMDLADQPDSTLEESFAQTPAFAWLTQCAPRFGFRMSFPENNRHGISYEPWHWCYVGVSAAEKWSASLR
jgi:zinc D-Ala-D-Ala carboxypeptidase